MMLLAAMLIGSATTEPSDNAPVADRVCAQALAEVARAAATQGWEADARCLGHSPRRPPAAATLTVQPLPASALWRSGAVTLTVCAAAARQASSTYRVPLRVTWIAPAWIATRTLAAGDVPTAEDMRVMPHRWGDGLTVHAAEGPLPQRRLKRAVRQGEALSADSLLPTDGLMRGDRLEAVLASGDIEIRTPVTLLAHARIGERVRVQPIGRADVLDGVLSDRSTVRVEGP